MTVLFTAPTAYRAMLAAGGTTALTSLRRCVSAGEHLPRADLGGVPRAPPASRIIDGIGSTEMLHIFVSAADDDDPARLDGRSRCPATSRRCWTRTASRCRTAARAGSR